MGRKQVNVQVTEERHGKWKEFVESNDDYHTLSALIRSAVKKEIDSAGQSTPPGPSLDETLEVVRTVERIESQNEEIASKIDEMFTVVEGLRGEQLDSENIEEAVGRSLWRKVIANERVEGVNIRDEDA